MHRTSSNTCEIQISTEMWMLLHIIPPTDNTCTHRVVQKNCTKLLLHNTTAVSQRVTYQLMT